MNAARVAFVALAAFASPCAAHAHAAVVGIGGFPGGLIHPLLVPAHGLFLVALGLMASQQDAGQRRLLFAVFVAAAATAVMAVTFAVATSEADLVVLAAAGFAGLLAAAGRPLQPVVPAAVAASGSAALVLDSVPPVISTGETLQALTGTALAAILALAIVAGIAANPKHHWQRIGIRILAAWVAAVSALVLALRLVR